MRRQSCDSATAGGVPVAGEKTPGMAMVCKRGLLGILATVIVGVASTSVATVLNGEYTINVTTRQVDADTWQFTYDITNVDQSIGGGTGLTGLYVQVPVSSVITNVSVPPAYTPPGCWIWLTSTGGNEGDWATPPDELLPGNQWLQFTAIDYGGPYPMGTMAEISFRASGVTPGLTTGEAYTCWQLGPIPPPYSGEHLFPGAPQLYYGEYSTALTGPVAVPEPGTFVLLGVAAVGLLGYAWSRQRQTMFRGGRVQSP